MNSQTAKKVTLALGVAGVASQFGSVAVQAGPALQTLNNLSNSAEFTINNTFGQSFSVQGAITAAASITPFASVRNNVAAGGASFNNGGATLETNFIGGIGFLTGGSVRNVSGLRAVSQVTAFIRGISSVATGTLMKLSTGTAGIQTIQLIAQTGAQTIGASISTTLFGPSNVKAGSSFTSQIINDLSAF